MSSEPLEQVNTTSSESSADRETNDQIYNYGSLTIVVNMVLYFIAIKKLWARMLLCEQLKNHYTSEDIMKTHNIV